MILGRQPWSHDSRLGRCYVSVHGHIAWRRMCSLNIYWLDEQMGDSGGTECRPMGGKHGTQEPEGRGSSPALPESPVMPLSLSLSHLCSREPPHFYKRVAS